MRVLYFSTLVVLGAAGSARAEDRYPNIIVDRPLVLAPDMSEVDVGVDFPTYGTGFSSHTALGDYRDVDVSVHHAFGPLQAGIRFVDSIVGPMISAGPRLYAGPGTIDVDLGIRLPTNSSGIDHEYTQSLRYTLKTALLPHVLAVYGGPALDADEFAVTYSGDFMPTDGHRLVASVGGGIEVQLLDELEVSANIGAGVPFGDTTDSKATARVGASVMYVIDRFDVYGGISVLDLRDARLPYASVGVVARFGG